MKCDYENIKTEDGQDATSFNIETRKGHAYGLVTDRIYIHGIWGAGCTKGILNILTKRFKMNKITFTPLINDNVKNAVRGVVKILPANDPQNPYGEDFEYLETEWVTS